MPAEAVPDASKNTGGHYRHFFIGGSFFFGRVSAQPALKSMNNLPKSPKLEPKWSQVGFQSQTFLALGTRLRGFVRPGVQVEPQVLPEASWQTWLRGE